MNFFSVCSFWSHEVAHQLNLHIVLFHVHVRQCSSYMAIQRKSREVFRVSVLQKVCNRHFVDCLRTKRKNMAILSRHDQVAGNIWQGCRLRGLNVDKQISQL